MRKLLWIGAWVVVGAVLGAATLYFQQQPQEPDNVGRGGSYGIGPITVLGTKPTSTLPTTYNDFYFTTTTATTTPQDAWVSIGPEINEVNLGIRVVSTSSPATGIGWWVEYSPSSPAGVEATSTQYFYTEDSAAITASVVTHAAATTTHQWLPAAGSIEKYRTVIVCSNTPDGTDDIPQCNAGWYKFTFFRVKKYGNFGAHVQLWAKN